ncbi:polysaccharide pyruvyl transferase family protein [Bacteroides faecichinchillae]|uniref:polysaccharide pyruvyl transferase family protein n=1 Tax=Bacteroides faecichinchillae TaxID=871325 RepID=UPI0035122584
MKKVLSRVKYFCWILKNKCVERRLISLISSHQNKTIFLFGSPWHSNMGDQAQTYCIQKWLGKNYPEYHLIVLTLMNSTDKVINCIRKHIKSDDLLMCHSGYHITNLYKEKDVYCKIARLFPDFKIFIFPQTINFVDDQEEEKNVSDIFNTHGQITLCCRDEFSFQYAQKIFVNCSLLLYPDIVTSLIGTKKYNNSREGVLFCMRNDIEALYTPEEIQTLRNRFGNMNTDITDTTIQTSYSVIKKKREKILLEMFEEFSKYELVVTDRYHGTIFSLIAGTPVIVISSTDHKLSSGVRWFPESFNEYVKYASNLDEVYQLAQDILSNKNRTYLLPAYFEQEYYSVLKSKL